jgi:hypothetical protein
LIPRAVHTNQYYEACFIGYLTIFREIAVNLLDFSPDVQVKLTDLTEKFANYINETNKFKADSEPPPRKKLPPP